MQLYKYKARFEDLKRIKSFNKSLVKNIFFK